VIHDEPFHPSTLPSGVSKKNGDSSNHPLSLFPGSPHHNFLLNTQINLSYWWFLEFPLRHTEANNAQTQKDGYTEKLYIPIFITKTIINKPMKGIKEL